MSVKVKAKSGKLSIEYSVSRGPGRAHRWAVHRNKALVAEGYAYRVKIARARAHAVAMALFELETDAKPILACRDPKKKDTST